MRTPPVSLVKLYKLRQPDRRGSTLYRGWCPPAGHSQLGTFRGSGTERARLGTFRGFGTERARLGTFRGFGTERARLGTLKALAQNVQD